MGNLSFAHEAPRRLRTAFLGTSGHAFRNFLPSLPYAPLELVALWDTDAARAEAFARQFGAPRWYTDVDRLLDEADPEAVLIAAEGMDGDEPRNTGLMARCLERGCHAWTDKPLATSAAGAARLIEIRDRVGKVAGVGIKTMFYPTYQRVREIVRDPAFGRPVSMTVRYPLHVPHRADLPATDRGVRSCLGHLWHPFGAALAVIGPIEHLYVEAAHAGGGGVAIARFVQGTVGAFHFSAGRSGTSPLEFLEVVGEGANVTVENAARLTYYRPGSPGSYGRCPSFLTEAGQAPLVWEPELSLGQLYNNNNFIQGYAPSIIAFAQAALGSAPLACGTLEDACEVLKVFDALRAGPGRRISLNRRG